VEKKSSPTGAAGLSAFFLSLPAAPDALLVLPTEARDEVESPPREIGTDAGGGRVMEGAGTGAGAGGSFLRSDGDSGPARVPWGKEG